MGDIAKLIGLIDLTVLPVLIGLYFYVYWRIGRMVSTIRPDLWQEMKLGFYSRIEVSRSHNERFREFLTSGEVESFQEPTLTRLARMLRTLSIVLWIAAPIGFITMAWIILG
jgi:hypothetical protein